MSEGPKKRVGWFPLIFVIVVGTLVIVVVSSTVFRMDEEPGPVAPVQPGQTIGQQDSVLPAPSLDIFTELQNAAQAQRQSEEEERSFDEGVESPGGVELDGIVLQPLEELEPLDPQEMLRMELEELRAQEELRREQARTAELNAALVAETTAYVRPGSEEDAVPGAVVGAGQFSPAQGVGERRFVMNPGTVIRGVLETDIDTSLPGQVTGRITEPVYDSTGERVLIRQGAQLVGQYGAEVFLEQQRVMVEWNYLVQDGRTIGFETPLAASDARGAGGLDAEIDRHFRRNLGNALLLSFFGAGVQLSQPRAREGSLYDPSQLAAASLGQQVGSLGLEYARTGASLAPTLRVAAGYRFAVVLAEPVELPEAGL